jgi:hypothetical protein
MLRTLAAVLLLSVPSVALAEDPPAPPPDAPTQAPIVPQDQAPPPQARWCGAHGCGGGSPAKFIVGTAVTASVLTAVAIAIAAGVARANATPAQTLVVR